MRKSSFNGFDWLAPVYDPLARLVFGPAIRDAQTLFLDSIPSNSSILILGGGTGWLLPELIRSKPQCAVWYIESSARMLEISRKWDHPNIHFIQGSIAEIPDIKFDVVITHFFLDMFPNPVLKKIVLSILPSSRPTVLWLAADFVDRGRWWQKALLQAMYLFFGVLCNIEARRLPSWSGILEESGLKKVGTQRFYRGFVESTAFTRS